MRKRTKRTKRTKRMVPKNIINGAYDNFKYSIKIEEPLVRTGGTTFLEHGSGWTGPTYSQKAATCKHEISHSVLDNIGVCGGNADMSARFRCAVGTETYTIDGVLKLVDKIIFPINICPYCKSNATYHHRIQQTGDNCDNVWSTKRMNSESGRVSIKNDKCLDCGQEFIIEMYVHHYVIKYKFIRVICNIFLRAIGLFKVKEKLIWNGREIEYK